MGPNESNEASQAREPIEADREALRFIRSWHQYPSLRDALTYRGVNVGEMMETQLLHEVVPVMLQQFPRNPES